MSVCARALSFRYPGATGNALTDVTVDFLPGLTVLCGPLGAGRSTLLLALAGLAPRITGGDRHGDVEVRGHDPSSNAGRAALGGTIGVLLPTPWTQLSGMAFSVWDEVAFGPANLGWPRDRIRNAVDTALDRVGAVGIADRDPRTLSGGELQRVMFASTLALEPDVLLLDEPTAELDPKGARSACALMRTLGDRVPVIVATSDIDRVGLAADRVIVLNRGSVIADGDRSLLGTRRLVTLGCGTTVANVAHHAGVEEPYPVAIGDAVERWRA